LIDLSSSVNEAGAAADWLDLIEREYGLIMAMARVCAEERRASKEEDR
jgi:hypothetical protein